MRMKQTGSLRRTAQAGFTLIELIVVIVILGILAATALPKFADMGGDARAAKIKGAQGAVSSAAAISRAKWLTAGDTTATSVTLDTGAITTTSKGYPTGTTIATAAGLLATDFTVTPGDDGATVTDTAKTTKCGFTYTASTGAVSGLDVSGC